MSVGHHSAPASTEQLGAALALIAASASARDQLPVPEFPEREIAALEQAGALAWNALATSARPPAGAELELVRSVARADGSVGRIFDGHLNAVERLVIQAPADVRYRELALIGAGRLRAGVWGGDPRDPGKGHPPPWSSCPRARRSAA